MEPRIRLTYANYQTNIVSKAYFNLRQIGLFWKEKYPKKIGCLVIVGELAKHKQILLLLIKITDTKICPTN